MLEGRDLAPLARGGMADLLLASASAQNDLVFKRVRDDLSGDRYRDLLRAEAELTSQLNHPNIVRCWGLVEEEGEPTMIMEHVHGLDLEALLRGCSKRRIVLPLSHRLALVCAILRALDYAHRARDEQGELYDVVHRDVSASNVLIGFEGQVKLCDFGIASATIMPALGDGPLIEGKASYMSPEQAKGRRVDGRADVFSVGVLLWELVAGRRMRRRVDGDRLSLAARGEVPVLPQKGFYGEPELHAIVNCALASEPDARYQTAGQFMMHLEKWCRNHRVLAGESELGRFLRAHFPPPEGLREQLSPASVVDEAPPAPSRDPPAEPTLAPVSRTPAPASPKPAATSPWRRGVPVLVAGAVITFFLLMALSKAGIV
ncbi:MAG: serine/threonine-protein kinase [Myxococcota bacterium]